eukprot:7950480-Pyramimonas_sp.AAC.1
MSSERVRVWGWKTATTVEARAFRRSALMTVVRRCLDLASRLGRKGTRYDCIPAVGPSRPSAVA